MKNVILALGFTFLFTQFVFAQWNSDPEENFLVASGNITTVKSVKTANNQLFVSWFYRSENTGNYNLFAQLIDENGNKLWPENGLLISSHPQQNPNVEEQVMLCDQDDNLVIIFSDIRENARQGLFCYKVNQAGSFLAGTDGLSLIGNGNNDWITRLSGYCDSENNIIVSATIYGQSNDVFLQKITSNNILPWGIQGKIIPNVEHSKVFSTGEKIMLLFRERTGIFPYYNIRLLYQLFNEEGEPLFANNKIISEAGGICVWDKYDALMTENHHVIVCWHDDRDYNGAEIPYAQCFDDEGNTLWAPNGIALTTEPFIHHFYPIIVGNESGNTIFAWQRTIDPVQWNKSIYGQKVDENGNMAWGPDGKELFPECYNFNRILGGCMDNNNVYIAFALHPTEGIYDTVHYYIGSYDIGNGDPNWSQPLSFATSAQPKDFYNMWLIPGEQIITTWREVTMSSNQEVRAQNIRFDGSLGPVTSVSDNLKNILSVYPNPSNQYLRINYDGGNIKSVMILDVFGNILYNQSLRMQNPLIDVSMLKEGLYVVKVQTSDHKTLISKFIRSRF